MGGDNPKDLNLKPSTGGAAVAAAPGGDVNMNLGERGEIHSAKGEVHFHNRTTKAKVAIPIPDFHIMFGEWIKSPTKPLVILDVEHQSRVTLSVNEKKQGDISDLDIDMKIEPLRLIGNLKKLIDFSDGK